jgi:nucleoside-triphosphatase
MGKTLLLTGHPGIGKTTIIRKIIRELGTLAGGFYTEEIAGPGGRKGFRLVTLDGQEAVLAHKDIRGRKVPHVGRYGVDVQALDRVGVAAIRRAMAEGKIVIVDEIGKMELYSRAFRDVAMHAVMSRSPVLGTIMLKPHPEADALKMLAQVTLWEVNHRTRAELPDRIVGWLDQWTDLTKRG